MDFILFIVAFVAGGVGTLLGGTQTFVGTGLIGLISVALGAMGITIPYFNDVILNVFFLPAVIFSGAGVATAYAALHHDIRGVETGRSLYFTKDIKVVLVGAVTGTVCYGLFVGLSNLGAPLDIGALVVITGGVFGRLAFNKEQYINKAAFKIPMNQWISLLVKQSILAAVLSIITCYLVKWTGVTAIGFYISAFSLYFALKNPKFPATHQITMVAGYAFVQTGSILMAIVFGVLAEIVFQIFGKIYNTDCGTHIDPPAVAIALFSLIIFTLF